VNDLYPSRRLELMGAGGQLGSMAAWEHSDGIPHGGWSASANSRNFCTEVTVLLRGPASATARDDCA
jgi:hypothetical protein